MNMDVCVQALLRDLNADYADEDSVPASSPDCVTTLPDVSKALADVADLVEVVDTKY